MITAGKASVATFWLFDEAGRDENPSSSANTKPKTGIQGLNTETGGLSQLSVFHSRSGGSEKSVSCAIQSWQDASANRKQLILSLWGKPKVQEMALVLE